MDSSFSRVGSSTSSVTHSRESQPEQTVEQEQATFTGRVTSPREPENPFLAALYASQATVPRAPRSAAATRTTVTRSMTTRSMVTRSIKQHSPVTDDLANSFLDATPFFKATSASQPIAQSAVIFGSAITDSPPDPFSALAAYQTIRFEDDRPQLYGGFGNFDPFLNAYLPEGLEAEPITSLPTEPPTLAPALDSSSQGADKPSQGQPNVSAETATKRAKRKTKEQTRHVPANPLASYQGHASAPAPVGASAAGGRVEFYDSPLILAKVRTSKRRKKHPTDKYLWRTNSVDRPYMCGYRGCGKTYKSSGHLREHMFDHSHISEHRCTYPECGPNRYFRRNRDLKRHIEKVHADQKS